MIAAKADGRLKPEEPVALSVVEPSPLGLAGAVDLKAVWPWDVVRPEVVTRHDRSEEHTSELQSLMRISYAVFCLKKKNIRNQKTDKLYTIVQYILTVHSIIQI